MFKPREAVLHTKEYHPPLGGRIGLRMDFNENTAGCSPRVLQKLREIDSELLAKYPERESVEASVAEYLGLAANQVLLTNGVDEGIHLLCQTYIDPGDEALIAVPTFSMYEVYASAAAAKVITVQCAGGAPRSADPRSGAANVGLSSDVTTTNVGAAPFPFRGGCAEDFTYPLDRVLAAITPRTRFIAVATPNNPTGTVVSEDAIIALCQAAPQAAVLIDEAYFDFYGKTVLPLIGKYPNLFVSRTFSKAHGLAGLRAGVLAGTAEQMRMVRRVSSPYNVNAVALALLPEALADREYMNTYVAEVKRGRERLQREFESLGIKCWPSEANFVLAYFGEMRKEFVAAMKQRGILVRDRNSDPGCAGCVRITAGSEVQMDIVIEALRRSVEDIRAKAEVAK
jgi:histidinol-phosphate aminotransferase